MTKPSHAGKQQQFDAALLKAITAHADLIPEHMHPDVLRTKEKIKANSCLKLNIQTEYSKVWAHQLFRIKRNVV